MKQALLTLFLLFQLTLWGQNEVVWQAKYDRVNSEILITATIMPGWHLYSQHVDNNVGPVPTSFTFSPSDNYTLKGFMQEPKAIEEYDENFEATLKFFKNEVIFSQEIEVINDNVLHGTVNYMICNDSKCLPPVDQKIELKLNSKKDHSTKKQPNNKNLD